AARGQSGVGAAHRTWRRGCAGRTIRAAAGLSRREPGGDRVTGPDRARSLTREVVAEAVVEGDGAAHTGQMRGACEGRTFDRCAARAPPHHAVAVWLLTGGNGSVGCGTVFDGLCLRQGRGGEALL